MTPADRPQPPAPAEIVRFDDAPPPPGRSAWIGGHGPMRELRIVAPDPAWPRRFAVVAGEITTALGDRALAIEHVGSTAVPGLVAKPVIDIDLIVADSREEAAYIPALTAAGFVHAAREPWWYEHRLLRRDGEPAALVHVFSPGAAEPERHRIFRDWLRAHPDDRDRYAAAKRAAADASRAAGEHTMAYNARKQAVVREIYGRAFTALGLVA